MGSAKELDKLVRKLALEIQTLRIDYERFFAGALDVPPEGLRVAIAAEFKTLRNASIPSVAENFRLSNLEAQFNTYGELFSRRLREREEGPLRLPTLAHGGPKAPAYDPQVGIAVGDAPDPAALEALYAGLYRSGEKADLESFRRYLTQQVEAIRQKTGCAEVQFRVAIEDGKHKLKAKPVSLRATA